MRNFLLVSQLEKLKLVISLQLKDIEKRYFNIKEQYYRKYGTEHNVFRHTSEFNPLRIKELLGCDIIHLSTGDPIEFRNAIKKRQMEEVLKGFL